MSYFLLFSANSNIPRRHPNLLFQCHRSHAYPQGAGRIASTSPKPKALLKNITRIPSYLTLTQTQHQLYLLISQHHPIPNSALNSKLNIHQALSLLTNPRTRTRTRPPARIPNSKHLNENPHRGVRNASTSYTDDLNETHGLRCTRIQREAKRPRSQDPQRLN